jgi:hypothetical protein
MAPEIAMAFHVASRDFVALPQTSLFVRENACNVSGRCAEICANNNGPEGDQ